MEKEYNLNKLGIGSWNTHGSQNMIEELELKGDCMDDTEIIVYI